MADGGETTSEGARIGWTPVPDPTKLTTDAVNLATTQIRRELATLREILEARILAGENESKLQLEGLRSVRPEIERSIGHLQELHDERFRSIALQFKERDVRTEQAQKTSQAALDAALSAAKELGNAQTTASTQLINAQAEAASREAERTAVNTAKQIDQINLQFEAERKAWDQRWQELKERIDRGEGVGAGESSATVEARAVAAANLALANHQQGNRANQISANAILVGVALLIVAIVQLIIAFKPS